MLKSTKLFLFWYKKEATKFNKEGNEKIMTIYYNIKLTDSARLTASLLSNLVNNLAQGIHKIKRKDCFLHIL